jgi:4-nitrophenyl phosphatase
MLRSKGTIFSGCEVDGSTNSHRQAACLRHQQQHQVARRLQEEVRQARDPCRSRTFPERINHSIRLTLPQNEVFGSSYSAAVYIARILKLPAPKNKVFVLGESGVEQELEAEGVPFIGGTDPAYRRDIEPEDFTNIANGSMLDPDVGIVLSGLDFHSNYLKTAIAFQYLQRGAKYLATNIDSTLPMSKTLFPGAGSSGAALAKAIGREPLSLGKPSQAMMDAVEGKFQFDRSRTCMVGDRLNTDIQFGIDGKLGGTLAVLTGVSKKEDFLAEGAQTVPTAYVNALGDLMG